MLIFSVLLSALVPIAVLYLLLSHHALQKRVARLEAQLARRGGGATPDATPDVPPDAGTGAGVGAAVDAATGAGTDDARAARDRPPGAPVSATPPRASAAEPSGDRRGAVSPWGGGPWSRAATAAARASGASKDARAAATAALPPSPPRSFVLTAENRDRVRRWLARNWFLAVAALSLALAGVFLVQYGVENGFISPFWRVMGAAFLGVALIWGGEFLRRRWGDRRSGGTAYLPSTFSGAGLVALFVAVLAARQLYGLVSPEGAFAWLVMVSAVAVALGWFYGPFLAAVGIVGSIAAPFLVGGESAEPGLFYYFFALVTLAALAVDAVRRWAWVSALAVAFAHLAALAIWLKGAGGENYIGFALIVAVGSVALPRSSLRPDHRGAMALSGLWALLRRRKGPVKWAEFPTRLAAAGLAGGSAVALLVAMDARETALVWLAVAALSAIYAGVVVWCARAPALDNLAGLMPGAFLALLVTQATDGGPLWRTFRAGLERMPETAPPGTASVLAAIALAGSALAWWRSQTGGRRAVAWAAGAALLAPLVLAILDVWWSARDVLGPGRWGGHAIIVAAAMVVFATRSARRDGDDRRRAALLALAAMTMISFALVAVLSEAALTLALAGMVLTAALTDRRLNLPALQFFVSAGAIVVGWRLIVEPGVFWSLDAPLWETSAANLGSLALLAAGWLALAARQRDRARMIVESGIWAIAGAFASVLLDRALGRGFEHHWGLSLFASVWVMLAMVQLYRLRAGGAMRALRIVLALVDGAVALAGFALVAAFANPLLPDEPVVGPPVLDSLLVAFGVPALVFAIGAWKIPGLNRGLRVGFITAASGLTAGYLGFEIRRLWQGRDLSVPGVLDGELYSYTVAMLLASVGVLLLAYSRRSNLLRQIATVGVGLTIAKVFLIDMAGLTGLLRVASFLGLGLSLAALGWLYRRMAARWDVGRARGRRADGS